MEKITKKEFMQIVYESVQKAKDDFMDVSLLPVNDADAVYNVKQAIFNGNVFIKNYEIMKFGGLVNEKDVVYYIMDNGAAGFCQANDYDKVVKENMTEETEYDDVVDDVVEQVKPETDDTKRSYQ